MIANSSFTRHLALLFVGLLDGVAYMILALSYRIFLAICQLDLFGGSAAGQTIYDVFTQKIYMILSVVMIFIFAYELILMIINPDGDGVKKTSNLLKNVVISIALVAVLPTVFKYMQVFQLHVIQNNTIGAIVLGTSPTASGKSQESYGDTISVVMLMAFYHPQGGGYDDFFDTLGNFKERDEAINSCTSHGQASTSTCESWYDALEEFWYKIQVDSSLDSGGVSSITWNSDLRKTIGDSDGSYYMWVISTGCALLAAWFFISYAIDIGTRAIKLGFLEIIAPVPVMLRIIPKMEKSFKTWQGELIKTYVELFIRVAVIFFIAKLCTLVPQFIDVIFKSDDMVNAGFILKGITAVVLILGLLKFAKEAPELFKSIMDNGGNLFKGINFKPGARKRIEDNEYAMRGISVGAGLAGGAAGAVVKRWEQGGVNDDGTARKNMLPFRAMAALTAAPRGVISGARSGWQTNMKKLNKESLKNTAAAGVAEAQAAEQRAYEGNLHSALRNTHREIQSSNVTNAESVIANDAKIIVKNAKEYGGNVGDFWKKYFANKAERRRDFMEMLSGTNSILSDKGAKQLSNVEKSLSNIENFYKNDVDKKLEYIKKAQSDDIKAVLKGQILTKTFMENGRQVTKKFTDVDSVKAFYKKQEDAAKAEIFKDSPAKMHAIMSQYKETSKLFDNSLSADTMKQINDQIQKKSSKLGLAATNLEDLVKFASGADASNNVTDFVKAMEIMEDVNKKVKEVKSVNEFYKTSQENMKNAQKDDKK